MTKTPDGLVVSKNTAGFIQRLAAHRLVEPVFPYMRHWKHLAIIQSFAGTASDHDRVATVGYIGHTKGGVVIALAGGSGWVGIRSTGQQSQGSSLDEAFRYAESSPFPTAKEALEHVINRSYTEKKTE